MPGQGCAGRTRSGVAEDATETLWSCLGPAWKCSRAVRIGRAVGGSFHAVCLPCTDLSVGRTASLLFSVQPQDPSLPPSGRSQIGEYPPSPPPKSYTPSGMGGMAAGPPVPWLRRCVGGCQGRGPEERRFHAARPYWELIVCCGVVGSRVTVADHVPLLPGRRYDSVDSATNGPSDAESASESSRRASRQFSLESRRSLDLSERWVSTLSLALCLMQRAVVGPCRPG